MHMPGCVGCVSALHVPAATRLQQHTPKTKNKQKYTVMNALHGIHGTQRKHPLERHTHTHTHRHGGSKARTPAAETMRPLHQHARTHARMHMQHTATGPGCEGKEKRGKGVTRRKRKKKKGRGQGVQLVRLHWIGTISGRAPPPAALPCTAPASNGGSGQRAARERSDEEKSPGVPDCTGRGEGWEGTQRVRVAAEMNLWEMLCCCQVAACAVAWVPAMHHHLVWRTQWHTPASVIIIISCGCLSGRVSPAAAAVTCAGNAAMEKLKREEEEEVEWEGQPPAAPMDAITATRHLSCTAVPNACASAQRKRSSSSTPNSRSSPPSPAATFFVVV